MKFINLGMFIVFYPSFSCMWLPKRVFTEGHCFDEVFRGFLVWSLLSLGFIIVPLH